MSVCAAMLFIGMMGLVQVSPAGMDGSEDSREAGSALSSPLHLDPGGLVYTVETVRFDQHGRHVETFEQTPMYVVQHGPGLLMGSSRGEWGGELVYRDGQGNDHRLLEENVVAIHANGGETWVFTGLAHKSSNDGAIHVVSQSGDGIPRVRLVHRLLGEPYRVEPLAQGAFRLQIQVWERPKPDESAILVPRCFLLAADRSLREQDCLPDES